MGYRTIRNVVKDAEIRIDDYQSGKTKPLLSSSAKENELIRGFYPGDLITLAAASGIGKTARFIRWLLNFCNSKVNPTMYKKVKIYFDTWEMEDVAIVMRIISSKIKKDVKTLLTENSLTPDERLELTRILAIISNLPMMLDHIPKDVNKYVDVKSKILDEADEDTQIVFGMDHTRMGRQLNEKTEERMITAFMENQVVLKKHKRKPIFFNLTQMNREYERRSTHGDLGRYMPIKSDIFGADSTYQCSDLVCIAHRPGYYGLTDFEGEDTGFNPALSKSRDTLWVEGWIKQREGATSNLFMRHQIERLKFVDI